MIYEQQEVQKMLYIIKFNDDSRKNYFNSSHQHYAKLIKPGERNELRR